MTAQRDYRVYLSDILDAIRRIEQYTANITLEEFRLDDKTQDAVIRNLEIIGEAVKRIPDEVRTSHPHIAWRPAAAMRDFLIHEYPSVDADAVWHTAVSDLPGFKKEVEHILEKNDGTERKE